MGITVECDRIDCGASFVAGMEGDWSDAPVSVTAIALADLDYGDLIYVYLPAGWKAERVDGLNSVIHCPEHVE